MGYYPAGNNEHYYIYSLYANIKMTTNGRYWEKSADRYRFLPNGTTLNFQFREKMSLSDLVHLLFPIFIPQSSYIYSPVRDFG